MQTYFQHVAFRLNESLLRGLNSTVCPLNVFWLYYCRTGRLVDENVIDKCEFLLNVNFGNSNSCVILTVYHS